jgi:hypothetical protein
VTKAWTASRLRMTMEMLCARVYRYIRGSLRDSYMREIEIESGHDSAKRIKEESALCVIMRM